jgi:hypothetical protein
MQKKNLRLVSGATGRDSEDCAWLSAGRLLSCARRWCINAFDDCSLYAEACIREAAAAQAQARVADVHATRSRRGFGCNRDSCSKK